MKKIICGLVVFIAAISARAQQPAYPTILLVTAAPSGACTVNLPDEQVATLGTIYTCQSGTWTLIGSGGGGSFNALTGDATSTSTGGATTVQGINGTLLSGLGTGLLVNTTGTGVPTSLAPVNGQCALGGAGSTWVVGPCPNTIVFPNGLLYGNGATTAPTAASATSPNFLGFGTNYNVTTSATISGDIFSLGGTITVSAGQVLTLTGNVQAPVGALFILGSGASVNLGKQNPVTPVEWFGAVGDYSGSGSGGTDNTVAFNACATAVGPHQCLLQALKYKVSGVTTITQSSVGFSGTSNGAITTAIANANAANVPASAIYNTSATADTIVAISPTGVYTNPISFNNFSNFTLMRTVAASVSGTGCPLGPSGLSIQFDGGFSVDRVWSEDSACNFYFQNAASIGTGYVQNSGSLWGANGFNPGTAVAGFYLNGAFGTESFRLRDSTSQIVTPGFSSVTSYGFIAKGVDLNDIMIRGFETEFQTYGIYIFNTAPGGNTAGDIHIIDCITDTFYNTGIYLNGLTTAAESNVEIKGGWLSTVFFPSTGLDIENSAGITVSNLAMNGLGSAGAIGIKAVNSSRLAINSNNLLTYPVAGIQLNTVSDSTITGNALSAVSGQPTTTFISGAAVTYTSITSNTIGGYGTTGISLDNNSNNNTVQNVVDPSNITTAVVNVGAGNFLPAASWPPLGATPTFTPNAGEIASGATVTTACSGGSPFASLGTTAVAGATGVTVSATGPVYGSCQGSGYFTTGTAYYNVATSVYLNTNFTEAASGTNLAGTVPNTCTAGSGCTWVLASGTDYKYQTGGGVSSSTTNAQTDLINTGVTNEVIRFNLTKCTGTGTTSACQFIVRYSSAGNYVAINIAAGTQNFFTVFNGNGGSFTTIGASTPTGNILGNYTITLSGTTITVVGPTGTVTGSMTGTPSTSGTSLGFSLNGATTTGMTISSLSAASS